MPSYGLFMRNRFELQTDVHGAAARLGLGPEKIDELGAALDVLYKSKIWLLDSYFGSVVDAVDAAGLRDESLIAFTADHGQQMAEGELFRWTHGPDLARDVVEVPWIVRGPANAFEPGRVDAPTRSIDVYPTLAGLSGITISPERGVAGVDLAPFLLAGEPLPELTAYSHGTLRHWSYFQPDRIENIWATARTRDALYTWKYLDGEWVFEAERIEGDRETKLDPDAHQDAARDLWRYRERMIEAFLARNPDAARSKEEELGRLRDEEADALRELGYIE